MSNEKSVNITPNTRTYVFETPQKNYACCGKDTFTKIAEYLYSKLEPVEEFQDYDFSKETVQQIVKRFENSEVTIRQTIVKNLDEVDGELIDNPVQVEKLFSNSEDVVKSDTSEKESEQELLEEEQELAENAEPCNPDDCKECNESECANNPDVEEKETSIVERMENTGIIPHSDPVKGLEIKNKKRDTLLKEKEELIIKRGSKQQIVDNVNINGLEFLKEDVKKQHNELINAEDYKNADKSFKLLKNLDAIIDFVQDVKSDIDKAEHRIDQINEQVQAIQLEIDFPEENKPVIDEQETETVNSEPEQEQEQPQEPRTCATCDSLVDEKCTWAGGVCPWEEAAIEEQIEESEIIETEENLDPEVEIQDESEAEESEEIGDEEVIF